MELVEKLSWQFPIAPNTVRGQATHLSLSEDKKTLAYGTMTNVVLRNIEVNLPNFIVRTLMEMLRSLPTTMPQSLVYDLARRMD